MPYPAAPWFLQGRALLTLHLVEVERVRSLLPPELNIISVLPGRTLGGVYFSRYESGSVLQYSELIVAPALVSYGGKIGCWVTHIYVDNADSVAGGREIWGLPKQLAEFGWEAEPRRVTVRQEGRVLCALEYGEPWGLGRLPIAVGSFSAKATQLLWFRAQAELRPGWVKAHLEVPETSPFALLQLGQPWTTLAAEELQLQVEGPTTIGPKA